MRRPGIGSHMCTVSLEDLYPSLWCLFCLGMMGGMRQDITGELGRLPLISSISFIVLGGIFHSELGANIMLGWYEKPEWGYEMEALQPQNNNSIDWVKWVWLRRADTLPMWEHCGFPQQTEARAIAKLDRGRPDVSNFPICVSQMSQNYMWILTDWNS